MELELRSVEQNHGLELRSTSTERLELISGRQQRGRGRCCWPRHYLGADIVQHAEGSEPLEQKGALHLGEYVGAAPDALQCRDPISLFIPRDPARAGPAAWRLGGAHVRLGGGGARRTTAAGVSGAAGGGGAGQRVRQGGVPLVHGVRRLRPPAGW
eukprot:scaffold2073_cov81-Phaeocystis_antarctica.AAC.1